MRTMLSWGFFGIISLAGLIVTLARRYYLQKALLSGQTSKIESILFESTSSSTSTPKSENGEHQNNTSLQSAHSNLSFLDYGFHEVQGRRETMEDAHCLLTNFLDNPKSALFCVFDGHGGRRAADFAAENFPTYLKEALEEEGGMAKPEEAIRKAFLKTEEVYIEKAVANQYQDGTTGVAVLILGDQLIVSNVGDSEAIISEKGRPVPLTTIHNPNKNPLEGKRVEEAGGRMYMGRVGHPALNVRLFNIAVSRAIGDILYKIPQYTQNKPSGLTAEPDTVRLALSSAHSFLILACDGLWDVMTHQDALEFVSERIQQNKSLASIAQELVEEAENKESTDNITACIVWVSP